MSNEVSIALVNSVVAYFEDGGREELRRHFFTTTQPHGTDRAPDTERSES